MDPEDFNKAMSYAHAYFAQLGIDDPRILLDRHVYDLFKEGETRPLILANRAIERMERQLEAELEIRSEELFVVFNHH